MPELHGLAPSSFDACVTSVQSSALVLLPLPPLQIKSVSCKGIFSMRHRPEEEGREGRDKEGKEGREKKERKGKERRGREKAGRGREGGGGVEEGRKGKRRGGLTSIHGKCGK